MGIYTTKGMKTEMMCEGKILCHIHQRRNQRHCKRHEHDMMNKSEAKRMSWNIN